MTTDDLPRDNDILRERFLTAQCPTTEEFNGVYKVDMLTGFPLWWNYKHIANRNGINKLLGVNWGRFRLKYGTVHGMNMAVLFDYDQPENGIFTRPIRDYLRRLNDGRYLGAFNYVRKGKCTFVGYFTMTQKKIAQRAFMAEYRGN